MTTMERQWTTECLSCAKNCSTNIKQLNNLLEINKNLDITKKPRDTACFFYAQLLIVILL